jgi:hypothetical protein
MLTHGRVLKKKDRSRLFWSSSDRPNGYCTVDMSERGTEILWTAYLFKKRGLVNRIWNQISQKMSTKALLTHILLVLQDCSTRRNEPGVYRRLPLMAKIQV